MKEDIIALWYGFILFLFILFFTLWYIKIKYNFDNFDEIQADEFLKWRKKQYGEKDES